MKKSEYYSMMKDVLKLKILSGRPLRIIQEGPKYNHASPIHRGRRSFEQTYMQEKVI